MIQDSSNEDCSIGLLFFSFILLAPMVYMSIYLDILKVNVSSLKVLFDLLKITSILKKETKE